MAESSGPQEDSKSSSDDAPRSGKSYECVFCKRGFTTAQALGGHMNIHRKHRAPKTNPRNDYSSDHHHHRQDHQIHEGFSSFRPFFAIQTYPEPHLARDLEVHVDGQTCDPNHDLLRENRRDAGLRLGVRAPKEDDIEDSHDHNKHKLICDFDEDNRIDLELRLGYKP